MTKRSGPDIETIRRQMQSFDWYHTIELGNGLVTKGHYDLRPVLKHYGLPEDMAGKSVLDIGPAHGFFAFEFEKRGAARVVTAELPRWSTHDGSAALKDRFEREDTDTTTLPYLHGALAFAIAARNSRVEQRFCNIYDLSPQTVGMFDIAFCGSLLIHLSDPLRALYAMRSVTREYAIISTTVTKARWYRAKPIATFQGRVDGQSFWAPNMKCLEQWALAAGFSRVERVSAFHLTGHDGTKLSLHGTIRAFV